MLKKKNRSRGQADRPLGIAPRRTDKAICLKCQKEFKSFDKRTNRICPKCASQN